MNILDGGGVALCVVGFILFVGFLIIANGIKIVPEYRRLVVFRLGRALPPEKRLFGGSGPGLTILIPGIDKASWVDLREQVRDKVRVTRRRTAPCVRGTARGSGIDRR